MTSWGCVGSLCAGLCYLLMYEHWISGSEERRSFALIGSKCEKKKQYSALRSVVHDDVNVVLTRCSKWNGIGQEGWVGALLYRICVPPFLFEGHDAGNDCASSGQDLRGVDMGGKAWCGE